jgi:non-specific serine/threonine protein kinase/serine/threonine-protein kinase
MDMTPSPERELFEQAIALPAADREPFLERHCADDRLRAQVRALLAAHERADDGFLARSASELAAAAIGRPGRRIGAYRIVREIGRGGMGAVYLATRADDEFNKEVAIKIVAAPLGDEDLSRRFRRERQILAELEHPLIGRLLDGGTTDEGLPFLVMELVDGLRIDEYCRSKRLDTGERLRLFLEVCDAVQYAHSHLVVHRDLKPHNILVTADGRPKLLDFGIATLVTSGDGAAGLTHPAMQAMTPEYASPEQLRGERISTASDVYSLGVVLFELLTGTRPYDLSGKRPDEIYREVTEATPARPSAAAGGRGDATLARRLRGDLDAIVLTALRKDPARRYASVAFFAEDLRKHLDGRPVAARGEAASYRVYSFVRRHRLPVAAAVMLIVTLVGGIVATARQARIADEQRQEAERQRGRAERRFAEVRQLAHAFLFDFHDAIANLSGSTQARHLIVTKAREYLDRLATEAVGDAALQQELAAAYDKVGDVQGNPSTANLGDPSAALESYRKAEAIRRRVVAENPQNLDARLELSTSVMKIADALVGRGAVKEAIGLYREALEVREAALKEERPSRPVAHRAVVETTGRLCTTLLATGDAAGALENCRRNRMVADAQLATEPADAVMLGHRATNSVALGNALRLARQSAEAEITLNDAIERHKELLKASPANAQLRRRLAIAYGYLANVHLDLQRPHDAARSFELAIAELSQLQAADPSNARTAPELAYMLNQRARILMALGRRAEARQAAARAIGLARAAAERPGAGGDAINEYAWALVSIEPSELRNPAQAAALARRAIERAGAPNPVYLHTLGTAQHLLGRRDDAIRTLEQALALMPQSSNGPASGLRKQIEADLAKFKNAG